MHRTLPALLLALVTATAALAQASLAPEKTRPDGVSVGMTIGEVEARMGRSPRSCWHYQQGEYEEDDICFLDGTVNSGLIGGSSARWRQPRFIIRPVLDASEQEVQEAWGEPDFVTRNYIDESGAEPLWYVATYRKGRLAEFTHVPVPPPPRNH